MLPATQLATDLPRGQCSADVRSSSSSSLLVSKCHRIRITVVVMVMPPRDYLRFSIQGQKQGLLDRFARPRPRTWHPRPRPRTTALRPRTSLAGLEDPRGQGRGLVVLCVHV